MGHRAGRAGRRRPRDGRGSGALHEGRRAVWRRRCPRGPLHGHYWRHPDVTAKLAAPRRDLRVTCIGADDTEIAPWRGPSPEFQHFQTRWRGSRLHSVYRDGHPEQVAVPAGFPRDPSAGRGRGQSGDGTSCPGDQGGRTLSLAYSNKRKSFKGEREAPNDSASCPGPQKVAVYRRKPAARPQARQPDDELGRRIQAEARRQARQLLREGCGFLQRSDHQVRGREVDHGPSRLTPRPLNRVHNQRRVVSLSGENARGLGRVFGTIGPRARNAAVDREAEPGHQEADGAAVVLDGLRRDYDDRPVLRDVGLTLARGRHSRSWAQRRRARRRCCGSSPRCCARGGNGERARA